MIKIKQIIRNIFTLDLRSLAIMRIMLGILVIINLIVICSNFEAFISDYGIFPISTALSQYPMQNYRWFHVISGSYRWQIPLFIIHFLIAIWFTLWYKTRTSTILLRIFTCSLQWSQHIFLHGGDTVMRLLLFRSMFLPLWEWYSIDSLKKVEQKQHICNISSFALIIQVLCIYTVSVMLKTDNCRTSDFSSIYYSLWIDYYATQLWLWLRTHHELIRFLSAYVYYLEWLWPLFYLFPNRKIKTAVCGLFILFHLWLAVFMSLGIFPWICISVWIWLLPYRYNNSTRPIYYKKNNAEYIVAISILLVIVRNIHSVYPQFLWNLFPKLQRYYYLTRLDQNRWLFAPNPSFSNGWHQIDGIYFNNTRVNLSDPDSTPYIQKPDHTKITNILPNKKRTRIGLTLNNNSYAPMRTSRALYICRKRNSKHSVADQIKSVQIQYHRQATLTGYEYGDIQTNERWTRDCPRQEAKKNLQ